MTTSTASCPSCGHVAASSEVFCTNCGARIVVAAVTPPPAPVAPPALVATIQPPVEQPTVTFPPYQQPSYQPSTSFFEANKKKVIGAGAAVLLLVVAVFGYQMIFNRVALTARNLNALFLEDTSRTSDFVVGTCGALDTLTKERSSRITALSNSISSDYTLGLIESTGKRSEISAAIDDWAEASLRDRLGSKYEDLEYADLLKTDLIGRAGTSCSLSITPNKLLLDAAGLDKTIQTIKKPPSNWEGYNFNQSDEDPNIAWSWNRGVSCGYGVESCWGVNIKVLKACAHTVTVKLQYRMTENGTNFDSDTEFIQGARPGKTYTLRFATYNSLYDWAHLDSVTCE